MDLLKSLEKLGFQKDESFCSAFIDPLENAMQQKSLTGQEVITQLANAVSDMFSPILVIGKHAKTRAIGVAEAINGIDFQNLFQKAIDLAVSAKSEK